MIWPEYGIGDNAPGTVSFPVWLCPQTNCGKTNDMLRAVCSACGWHRLCETCGSNEDVHMFPTGVRCKDHI